MSVQLEPEVVVPQMPPSPTVNQLVGPAKPMACWSEWTLPVILVQEVLRPETVVVIQGKFPATTRAVELGGAPMYWLYQSWLSASTSLPGGAAMADQVFPPSVDSTNPVSAEEGDERVVPACIR